MRQRFWTGLSGPALGGYKYAGPTALSMSAFWARGWIGKCQNRGLMQPFQGRRIWAVTWGSMGEPPVPTGQLAWGEEGGRSCSERTGTSNRLCPPISVGESPTDTGGSPVLPLRRWAFIWDSLCLTTPGWMISSRWERKWLLVDSGLRFHLAAYGAGGQ